MTDLLDLHHRLCCEVAKQEIPEVAEAIALIRPLVLKNWRAAYKDARSQLLSYLEQYPEDPPFPEVAPIARAADRESAVEEILAFLLALFLARLTRPWPGADLEVAKKVLLRLSGQAAGVFGAALDPRSLRTQQLYQTLLLDVNQITAGHLALSRARVEDALKVYLTTASARRAASPALAFLRTDPIPDRVAWEKLLDEAAGASGEWARVGADAWGYRAWNSAAIEGALARQVEAIQIVNNPPRGPDARTTPFCRWIHGQVFPIVRVKKFLDNYRQRLLEGDAEGALEAWPWLKDPKRVDEKAWRVHVKKAPLPPYHALCRSQAFPV